MTQSIHTTRRELQATGRQNYGDESLHRKRLERLRAELDAKERVKAQTHRLRRGCSDTLPTPPASVPIRVLDEGPSLHYPASPEDIRRVLALLPPGTLDGLAAVELWLGANAQSRLKDDWRCPLEPDPLTRRLGFTLIPGVFSGRVLGQYAPHLRRIYLMGYVYADDLPERPLWELYLRLLMLSTLMHELGHHYDWMNRRQRGRWCGGDPEKNEAYAERRQHEWVQQYVVPYLQEAYPDETAALEAWIRRHGGVSISLGMLAGSEEAPGEVSAVRAFFHIQSALWDLAGAVYEGEAGADTRVGFARELHYGQYYAEALASLDQVLAEAPTHPEALTLVADIYEHQDRFDEALEAMEPLCGDERYWWEWLIQRRARAHLWLGATTEFEAALAELEAMPGRTAVRAAARLRKEQAELHPPR